MQARRILNCLTLLLLCNNMFFDSIAADRLDRMSILLGYGGWRDLEPLEIVEDGVAFKVESLLSDEVTDKNVDDKIRQAHHFLSCQYAIVFLVYNEYLCSLGKKCSEMTDSEERQCLNKFMEVFDPEILVSRLRTVLSYFNSVRRPLKVLIEDVFNILTKFGEAYESINHRKNGDGVFENNAYVYAANGMLEVLRGLQENAFEFFENNCGPMWYLKEKKFGSSAYSWVGDTIIEIDQTETSPVESVNRIYTIVNYAINGFLISDYTRLGFEPYSKELSTSVLNENPDSGNRVQLADDLLSYYGWSLYLDHLRIKADDRLYDIHDLRKIGVDEENIDRKIRHVYQLISCYYAEVLTELFLYKKSISQFFTFGSAEDKFAFLKSFVKTIKKSDTVIMQMRDTLLYYQRLFLRTSFDKYILNILDYFKNTNEMTNFHETKFFIGDINNHPVFSEDKLLEEINTFLDELTEVEIKLIIYNLMSCRVPSKLKQYVVPQKSKTDMEDQIDKIIESFKEVVISLGFMYNPLSSPPVTLLPKNLI